MSEAKRLHPVTVLYELIGSAKELVIPFILIVVVNSGGRMGKFLSWLPLVTFGAVFLFGIAFSVIRWIRFKYWVEENELRIEQGLFVKKKRYIPFERIQSLDLSEGIFHRPFGLVKVKVETAASGGDSEAELTAIKTEDANALKKLIADAKRGGLAETAEAQWQPQGDTLYQITGSQLLFLASTSGRAGVVISAVLAFLFQLEDVIPYEKIFAEVQELARFGVLLITVFILIGLLVAWLLSVGIAFFKYNAFTVRKVEDELIITRGLVEKRTTTVPLHRIQALSIVESPIRQPFGYASVSLESAGGASTDLEGATLTLLPVVKKRDIERILSDALPDYQFAVSLERPPKRALSRYFFIKMVIALLAAATCGAVFWPYGLFAAILLPLVIGWGYAQYRSAGWNVTREQLTMQFRGIQQHRMLIRKNRTQSMRVRVSWFQRRAGLAAVSAAVKSGDSVEFAAIPHLGQDAVGEIYHWFSQADPDKTSHY